jgi:hypothetical protein
VGGSQALSLMISHKFLTRSRGILIDSAGNSAMVGGRMVGEPFGIDLGSQVHTEVEGFECHILDRRLG